MASPTDWEIVVETFNVWRSEHTVLVHAMIASPFGYSIAQYIEWVGGVWYWSILTSASVVAIAFWFQEWIDKRASKRMLLYFQKHQAPRRKAEMDGDHGIQDFTGFRKTHEIWPRWSWRNWVGGIYGAVVGGILAVTML